MEKNSNQCEAISISFSHISFHILKMLGSTMPNSWAYARNNPRQFPIYSFWERKKRPKSREKKRKWQLPKHLISIVREDDAFELQFHSAEIKAYQLFTKLIQAQEEQESADHSILYPMQVLCSRSHSLSLFIFLFASISTVSSISGFSSTRRKRVDRILFFCSSFFVPFFLLVSSLPSTSSIVFSSTKTNINYFWQLFFLSLSLSFKRND